VTATLTPVSTDLERKTKELMLKHRHRTTRGFSFSLHKAPAQAQDVADQHFQVPRIPNPHTLDVSGFAKQLPRPQFPDATNVGDKQPLPGSAYRVTVVEPGKPFDQFWEGLAESSTDHFGTYALSVVTVLGVRLRNLVHYFLSRSVIPRSVNSVIYGTANCIDIRRLQRDDTFIKRSMNP
jgi:hypothetical protein